MRSAHALQCSGPGSRRRLVPSPRVAAQRTWRSARRSQPSAAVTLELTDSQILRVCEEAGAAEPRADLIERFGQDAASLGALLGQATAEQHLSMSLVRGLFVLATLPSCGETVGVLDLAGQLEMSASTVHRYLQTLVIAGLARRNETTREY